MTDLRTSKYIERDFAVELLKQHLAEHAKTPVDQGENAGYNIGHSLGYSDGISYALQLLKDMPQAQKPERQPLYHHTR